MPVPTSTIAFGVLTCIPFGLAIKDTVKGTPTSLAGVSERMDRELEREQHLKEMERYEIEQSERRAAEAAAERATKQKWDDVYGQLFATSPATLGPSWKLTLGGAATTGDVVADRSKLEGELGLQFFVDRIGDTVHGVALEPSTQTAEACNALDVYLAEQWGSAIPAQNKAIWTNGAGTQRAVLLLSGENCKLIVERSVTFEQWIDKTESSIVPLWAVGQPAAAVAQQLKLAPPKGDTFEWTAPGPGAYVGKTELVGYVKGGKVVAIVAHARHNEENVTIGDHMVATFGDPTDDSGGDELQWNSKPPIALEMTRSSVSITVGKVPE